MVGAAIHQLPLLNWFIEDAAISFSYARNLADGEGLVTYVGGERVEGYSNPTWVFLLAFFELLGAESFVSAKYLQAALAAFTIPLTYFIARESVAEPETSDVPVLACVILAGSAQFAIWGASGLENALFSFLLALAIWRLLVESRTGTWPWSAACFFLVAISRPEAIMYAALGGFGYMVFTLIKTKRPEPTLKWLATFWAPFLIYHAIRFSYFAQELPNTFYAKIGEHKVPKPLVWNGRGWKYVRNFAYEVGHAWWLPLYVVGLTSGRGWRAIAGIAATTFLAVAILLPLDQRLLLHVVLGFTFAVFYAAVRSQGRPNKPILYAGVALVLAFIGLSEVMRSWGSESSVAFPDWLTHAPPYIILPVVVLLPILTAGSKGWRGRVICWGMCCISAFFAIWVLGDWMKGYRWMSLMAVPGSVLLATGAGAFGDIAQELFGDETKRWTAPGYMTAVILTAVMIPPNIAATRTYVKRPDTGPFSVHKRVNYTTSVAERLHLQERVVNLDVDQGAHLWWSGYEILDIAGLVDVPMGHHKFEKAFIREHVFEEKKPHFAHVHGGWATTSKIPTHPEWRRDYFEIPGYPTGKSFHIGNHIRKDLLLQPFEQAENRRIEFESGVILRGWRLPSPVAATAHRFYVEAAFQAPRLRKDEGFRVLFFLADGREEVATWDIAMGYDWLPPEKWKDDDIFVGRYSLMLPDKLPQGTYDIGFVVIDHTGKVMAAEPHYDPGDPTISTLPKGAMLGGVSPWEARVARGEVQFPAAIQLVDNNALEVIVDKTRADSLELAKAGDCDAAEHTWWVAKMYRPRATAWFKEHRPEMGRAFANCWVAAAKASPDDEVAFLTKAHDWDHNAPSLIAASKPVVNRLFDEGKSALNAEDWETAYRRFSDVLEIEPQRAWARRYAEKARPYRLGFDAETLAEKERERQERQEDLEKRRKERKAERAERPSEQPLRPVSRTVERTEQDRVRAEKKE